MNNLYNLNYLNIPNTTNNTHEYKRYWPVPPVSSMYYEYQNINKDSNLRELETKFFYNKALKWITDSLITDPDKITLLNSNKGYKIIYKLLRKYVKRSNINWYDLKNHYSTIKNYLLKRI